MNNEVEIMNAICSNHNASHGLECWRVGRCTGARSHAEMATRSEHVYTVNSNHGPGRPDHMQEGIAYKVHYAIIIRVWLFNINIPDRYLR